MLSQVSSQNLLEKTIGTVIYSCSFPCSTDRLLVHFFSSLLVLLQADHLFTPVIYDMWFTDIISCTHIVFECKKKPDLLRLFRHDYPKSRVNTAEQNMFWDAFVLCQFEWLPTNVGWNWCWWSGVSPWRQKLLSFIGPKTAVLTGRIGVKWRLAL